MRCTTCPACGNPVVSEAYAKGREDERRAVVSVVDSMLETLRWVAGEARTFGYGDTSFMDGRIKSLEELRNAVEHGGHVMPPPAAPAPKQTP